MLIQVLDKVAWPTVVVIVFIIFAKPLRALIARVNSAKFKGVEATFGYGQATVDVEAEQASLPVPATGAQFETPDWAKSGSLFWLAHDLVWTIDVLLRGGPARDIAWGLNQSLHHAGSIGLTDDHVAGVLRTLVAAARGTNDDDWTPQRRNEVSRQLGGVITQAGDAAKAAQPGFQPQPAGADPRSRTFT
jgi:hypothetical protein